MVTVTANLFGRRSGHEDAAALELGFSEKNCATAATKLSTTTSHKLPSLLHEALLKSAVRHKA